MRNEIILRQSKNQPNVEVSMTEETFKDFHKQISIENSNIKTSFDDDSSIQIQVRTLDQSLCAR